MFSMISHVKTYRGTIKVLVRFTKNVPDHLESLYTFFNQLGSLTNQLEQSIKLLN